MADPDSTSSSDPHPGGNPEFWKDDAVRDYDRRQALIAEGKGEALDAVVRILAYFHSLNPTREPLILDIGCGPGTLSTRILDAFETCVLVGVDASDQMVDAARRNLKPKYGDRFDCYTGDFNSNGFWAPEVDRVYDYVVSSGALHYLSDMRRPVFLAECYAHLRDGGAFVANVGTCSENLEVVRMQETFRTIRSPMHHLRNACYFQ